jgi:isopentenyl-diphosphate delta-isomerase
MEFINLVDEDGQRIGKIKKMEAHTKGKLHEAFSIFIFNDKQEMLLQRRALTKYHSGGLWTNTCCSHPRVYEHLEKAAHRRLWEEMGFDCPLTKLFSFIYRAEDLTDKLIEHEYDYVFAGTTNLSNFNTNPGEVDGHKWMKLDDIKDDVAKNPQNYTSWFKIIISKSEIELKKFLKI